MGPVQSSPVALRCLIHELQYISSSIQINILVDVFGVQRKCSVLLGDIQDFSHMRPIATPSLDAYML